MLQDRSDNLLKQYQQQEAKHPDEHATAGSKTRLHAYLSDHSILQG